MRLRVRDSELFYVRIVRAASVFSLLFLLLGCFLRTVAAAKLHPWYNSETTLMEGSLAPRYGHGFAATKDDKLYVFGGWTINNGLQHIFSYCDFLAVKWLRIIIANQVRL
jgi:hypothetical protein